MANIILDGLPMSILRDMYKQSQSVEVAEYVRDNYGMKGLRSLDLSLAIGITSNELENNYQGLLMEINSQSYSDLDTLFKLIYDVFTMIDSVLDPRFENLMTILREMNLDNSLVREREISRSFVSMILSFVSVSLDSGKGDRVFSQAEGAEQEVIEAILENDTLTEDMVFGWLFEYPNLVKSYVSKIRQIKQDQIIKDGTPEYLLSEGIISFVSILMIVGRYYQYIDEYNQGAGIEIDKENSIAEVIDEIINDIETNEYDDAKDNMAYIFEESSYSLILKTHTMYVYIFQLFWSIWLKKHISEVLDYEELSQEIENGDLDFYEEVYSWRREINNGTSIGLIYALFYTDLVSEHQEMFKDLDVVSDEDRFKDALNRIMNQNLLHETFKTSPEEYVNTVAPVLFPGVSLFNTSAVQPAGSVLSDAEADEVLNALGI